MRWFTATDEQIEADEYGRAQSDDLAEALAEDDAAEDLGMHGDDRRTCWTCQSWADHGHDWLTGEIVADEG